MSFATTIYIFRCDIYNIYCFMKYTLTSSALTPGAAFTIFLYYFIRLNSVNSAFQCSGGGVCPEFNTAVLPSLTLHDLQLQFNNNLASLLHSLTSAFCGSHYQLDEINFIFFPFSDVEKEDGHPNLENVPSNLYESVCMPDFNEFFQQQGDNFPVTDHNKNTTMNNNNNNTTGQQQQQQYMESKYLISVSNFCLLNRFNKRHRLK